MKKFSLVVKQFLLIYLINVSGFKSDILSQEDDARRLSEANEICQNNGFYGAALSPQFAFKPDSMGSSRKYPDDSFLKQDLFIFDDAITVAVTSIAETYENSTLDFKRYDLNTRIFENYKCGSGFSHNVRGFFPKYPNASLKIEFIDFTKNDWEYGKLIYGYITDNKIKYNIKPRDFKIKINLNDWSLCYSSQNKDKICPKDGENRIEFDLSFWKIPQNDIALSDSFSVIPVTTGVVEKRRITGNYYGLDRVLISFHAELPYKDLEEKKSFLPDNLTIELFVENPSNTFQNDKSRLILIIALATILLVIILSVIIFCWIKSKRSKSNISNLIEGTTNID